MISIYQIYFDENTKTHLEPGFIPVFNEKKDGFFENTIIKDVYEKLKASFPQQPDYIGISSWKQRQKTNLKGEEIISHIQNDINKGAAKDVYLYTHTNSLTYSYDNVPEGYYCNGIIKDIDIWHGHKNRGKEIADLDDLLNNSKVLPFDLYDGKWQFCYGNYWIAKTEVFNEYCEKILLPALAFFEREDIKPLATPWYTHSHEGRKYPSYSFTFEGLFGAFLAHSTHSYSYIVTKREGGKFQKINVLSYKKPPEIIDKIQEPRPMASQNDRENLERILKEQLRFPAHVGISIDFKIEWHKALWALNNLKADEKNNKLILKQACGIPIHAEVGANVKILWRNVIDAMGEIAEQPKSVELQEHLYVNDIYKTEEQKEKLLTMKIAVVVVVYNRLENMKEWIRCWKMCEQLNAEFVVIHNYDKESDCIPYKKLRIDNGVNYVPRKNIGFDIGAFQDVCRERLDGFNNDWDILFWATDDIVPMRKDFLFRFANGLLSEDIGVSCMHISDELTQHIRTNGFCIKKDIATKLIFRVDPIKTKDECWGFEHRDGNDTMMHQIESMGVKVVMPDVLKNSYVYDVNYPRTNNRLAEHQLMFPANTKKVTFICTIFNSFPEIVSSLICQTYKNWELILIHDGPCETNIISEIIKVIGDKRITFIETKERKGKYGHPLRQWALNEIKANRLSSKSDYIVITNADNYHAPGYCQYLIKAFEDNPSAIASYSGKIVHNYSIRENNYCNWGIIDCELKLGSIDCGGVMVRKDIACDIGWRDTINSAADWTFFEDIIKKYGKQNWVKVNGCLFIHN